MKNLLLAGAAVLTLGVGAYSVYAEDEDTIVEDRYENTEDFRPGYRGRAYEETRDLTEEERDAWFDEMHRERRVDQEERIQRDLDAGRITEDEAAAWREDLEADQRYYEENGEYRRGHHYERRNRNGYGHHGYNRNNRRGYGYCH